MNRAAPSAHLVVVARDAAATRENAALIEVLEALHGPGEVDLEILLQQDGPLADRFTSVAPTQVAAALRRRSLGAAVERGLGRLGWRATAGRVRGRRLGFHRLGAGSVVYLHDVLAVQVLRYLPPDVPVLCRVPESAHPLRQPLSAPDLALLLDRVTRFLAVTDAGVDELTEVHGVAPEKVVRTREAVTTAVEVLGDPAEQVAALRRDLGLLPGVVVVAMFGAAAVEIHAPAAPLAVAIRRHLGGEGAVLLLVVPEHVADPWVGHDLACAGLSDGVVVVRRAEPAPPFVELCDLVVHAGWGGDHPLAYLEAAAAGRPIVCSDGHELAEVVGRDEGGFVCARLDLAALADRVRALVVDPELRRAKGSNAAARVTERFGTQDSARRLGEQVRAVARR